MQTEGYCLAVRKNTRKHTFESVGVDNQVAEKVRFRLLSSLPTKPLLELHVYIHTGQHRYRRTTRHDLFCLQTGKTSRLEQGFL